MEMGDTRAVDPLISLLGDENYKVRQGAATGLGRLGDRKAAEPLIKALETEREADVRISEVQALGILGGPEAIKGLSRISTDKDEYRNVRINAEKALVILKGGGTVNASSFF
jgi:HEAT repeat protein